MRKIYLLTMLLLPDLLFSQPKTSTYKIKTAAAKSLVQQVLKSTPVIDGHNDLFIHYFDCKTCPRGLNEYRIDTINTGHTDIPRWRKGGVGGQLLNVFGDDSGFESVLRQYDLLYQMQEAYPKDLEIVGSSTAMRKAMKAGKIAILPSLEGAKRLKTDFSLLRSLYQQGLRSVTFAYKTNDLCDGSDDTARHNGVSTVGKLMIAEMNRLGILIDLSHVSTKSMEDILANTKAPIIFSHSNARALCETNRNVPDEILKELKRNGGMIMLTFVPYFTTNSFNNWMLAGDTVYYEAMEKYHNNRDSVVPIMEKWEKENTMPDVTVADMADHFDYVKNLIGVDHIGIAGDFDGIQFTISGLDNVSTYPNLLVELAKRGWTANELKKISGENFLRVFEQAEQVAARLKKETRPIQNPKSP